MPYASNELAMLDRSPGKVPGLPAVAPLGGPAGMLTPQPGQAPLMPLAQPMVRAPAAQSVGKPLASATPQQPQDYSKMTHARLLNLRNSLAPNDPLHATIAPYEHAAFAREWTAESPLTAVPSLLAGIPAYTLAKATNLTAARSPPSLAEMAQSYEGVGQGLVDAYQQWRGQTP